MEEVTTSFGSVGIYLVNKGRLPSPRKSRPPKHPLVNNLYKRIEKCNQALLQVGQVRKFYIRVFYNVILACKFWWDTALKNRFGYWTVYYVVVTPRAGLTLYLLVLEGRKTNYVAWLGHSFGFIFEPKWYEPEHSSVSDGIYKYYIGPHKGH